MRPDGVHDGVPAENYHAWDACSNSRLTDLMRSPAYCRWRVENPAAPTPAQLLGTACHYAVLEPDKFESVYAAAGQCEATTGKGGRCSNVGAIRRGDAWFCRVKNHAPPAEPDAPDDETRIVLPRDELDRALAIRDAVHANRVAAALLTHQVRREVSMLWTDERTALRCKGRVDVLGADVVADLKVTRDAHPAKFERFVGSYGLYRQAAFYLAGLRACVRPREMFAAIAVEPEPPHEVCVYALDPHAIRCGEEHVRRLVGEYRACVDSGRWPGYATDVRSVSVPFWVARDMFPEEVMA